MEGMDIDLDSLFGHSRANGGPFRSQTFSSSRGPKEQRLQDTTIEKEIHIALEDIAKGIDKKMKISRRVFDESGGSKSEEKILTIKVKKVGGTASESWYITFISPHQQPI